MKGMENFNEKKEEIKSSDKDIKNITTNITENDERLCNDLIHGKNSGKKEIKDLQEINGNNLLPLNQILNKMNIINMNNSSNEFCNDDEIKNNNKLFEDIMKQENNNNIYYNELNKNKNNNDNSNYYNKLKENYGNNNIDIDFNQVNDNIMNDIKIEFGNELPSNISNIIKKYVNDDILTYDYSKITENIIKECKKNNISQDIIEKAIKQIPDFYYLILCKKL